MELTIGKGVFMKISFIIIVLVLNIGTVFSQDLKKDSITGTVEKLYKTILPILDRVEFSGSSSTSQEISRRWNNVINHLKGNQENIAEDVKNMLVTPSGIPLDLDAIKRFIQITEEDSIKKVRFNPDFLLDEMKAAAEEVKEATQKIAKKK